VLGAGRLRCPAKLEDGGKILHHKEWTGKDGVKQPAKKPKQGASAKPKQKVKEKDPPPLPLIWEATRRRSVSR
jgi:hypothetical protein